MQKGLCDIGWSDEQKCTGCNTDGTAFHQKSGVNGFLVSFFLKAIGPIMVHVDNKGIIDGLWRGEMKCIGPKAKHADLWISIEIAYRWRSITSKRIVSRRRSNSCRASKHYY